MVQITLPDGSLREFPGPVTVAEVAASIGAGLAKAALGGKVNGQLVDTSFSMASNSQLAIVTAKDSEGLELIRHSIDFSQRDVEGVVQMELYKGNCTISGRKSAKALYNADLASMEIEGGGDVFDYNPADAQGFIRINSVRLKTYAALRAKIDKEA